MQPGRGALETARFGDHQKGSSQVDVHAALFLNAAFLQSNGNKSRFTYEQAGAKIEFFRSNCKKGVPVSAFDHPTRAHASGGLAGALNALAVEASVLIQALLSPSSIIQEVQEVRALQTRADGIEATDPARAAVLRWHASRVGLLSVQSGNRAWP
ncbi:hypothetical protein [Variovorax saccharolyticus]|uniref:hypothetical protein n=1 Tax=Variovorax saccharolyticus TaxID=3053516 RepID=UPI002574C66E|nr:hypothetical protein [Variovorax sp. J22R187]MDM0018958.1 hypothetical protein [Variovorax sp. J22R187]